MAGRENSVSYHLPSCHTVYSNVSAYIYKSKHQKSSYGNTLLENADPYYSPKVVSNDVPSSCVKLGMKMDKVLHSVFSRWGTFCASRPYLIILIGGFPCRFTSLRLKFYALPYSGVVFVAVCTSGLVKMQVTTDPVELWSSPESEARIQKKYFDSHFEPFYRFVCCCYRVFRACVNDDLFFFFRTEQLIIVAKNWTGMEYQLYTDSTDPKDIKYVHFGPILGFRPVLDEVCCDFCCSSRLRLLLSN